MIVTSLTQQNIDSYVHQYVLNLYVSILVAPHLSTYVNDERDTVVVSCLSY